MKKISFILGSGMAAMAFNAYAAIDCAVPPTCDSLGYTDDIDVCPGEYLICPFDNTKGKCFLNAQPGQIGYFVKNPGKGWLQCNGYHFHKDQYPDLYKAIGTTLSGGGSIFQVPDYSGDFLRVYGGNSGSVNKRQQEGLPDIYASWKSAFEDQNTGGVSCSGALSCSQYSGIAMEIPQSAANAYISRTFRASSYNSIYGASSHVTPVNTAVYAYMYAGRYNNKASSAAAVMASCAAGNYLYTDGSCSSSYNSSKTLKGIVASVYTSASAYSYVKYIWGGNDYWSTYTQAQESCKSQDNGFLAYYSDWSGVPSGIPTTQSKVRSRIAGKYYWSGSGKYYCSSSTSCSSSTASGDSSAGGSGSPYYYCYGYIYFAK